jgi:RNAse (barnase) inhibitor barstar
MNFYVLKTKGIRGTSSPFPSNNKILFKYKINWKNLMSSKTHHSQYIYIFDLHQYQNRQDIFDSWKCKFYGKFGK